MPWRIHEADGLQILLITSRETRRWVIPKGGRMAGKTDAGAAAIEAREEAGVLGVIEDRPLGRFRYLKRAGPLTSRRCVVSVFPMRVVIPLGAWLEDHQRTRQWMSREEAARAIHEPDLAALILSFSPTSEEAAQ
jgi:8-oxo-dGTP pyrophosphatase MutT (NUDIX family)